MCRDLARALHQVGRSDEADREFARSIQDRRDAGLDKTPSLANTLGYYGQMNMDLGRLDQALELFTEAVSINGQTLGEGHPATGTVRAQRGSVLCRLARVAEGRSEYQRAIAVLENALPDGDPRVQRTRDGMTTVCGDEG